MNNDFGTVMVRPGGGTETDLYLVHRRAVLKLLELDPADRAALDAAIARLVDLPEQDWPSAGAIPPRRREGDRPVDRYMLELGPSLRAFVRPTPGGKPEVLDFLSQEFLDMFKESLKATEPPTSLGADQTS
jgi:hypothetical protein